MNWEERKTKWVQLQPNYMVTRNALNESARLADLIAAGLKTLCQPVEAAGFSVKYLDPLEIKAPDPRASDALHKRFIAEIRAEAGSLKPEWLFQFEVQVINGGELVFFAVEGGIKDADTNGILFFETFEWASLKVEIPETAGESRCEAFLNAFDEIELPESEAMAKWWAIHAP